MSGLYEPRRSMQVIEPLSRAIERSRKIFFENFDIGVWLRFGLIILLATLGRPRGEAGGGGGGGRGGVSNTNQFGGGSISDSINSAHSFLMENLFVFILVGGILFTIILGLWLLLMWLGSRGQMMLIRAVCKMDPGIERNWGATKRQANSVFRFRIAVGIVFIALFLTVLGVGAAMMFGFATTGNNSIGALFVTLLPVIITAICLGVIGWGIRLLLINFVLPLMYLEDLLCMEGWGRFTQVARGNWGAIFLLLIVRFFYFIAFVIVSVLVGCMTCCMGFLPYVHHTLLAPFYVFDRAYSLYALQSLGPDFQFMEFEEGLVPPELPEDYRYDDQL